MKIYEYKGKHYCDEDISLEDDDYGGDLYDLYWELKKDGLANEYTYYKADYCESDAYESAEDLIENEFEDLLMGESDED